MAARKPSAGGSADAPAWAGALEAAVRQADLIIANNIEHRWLSERDARDARSEGLRLWTALLTQTGELTLRALGERLEGNGWALVPGPDGPGRLAQQMDGLEARCLVFAPNIAEKDFSGVMEILSATPEDLRALGGVAEFARQVGLQGVSVRSLVLREVAEDEMVVRGSVEEAQALDDPRVRAALVAFLAGSAAEAEPAARAALLEGGAAADAATVGALEAAVGPRTDDPRADATRMAEGVRRVFGVWVEAGETGTQKGRRECARRLRALRDGLAERLGDQGGPGEAVLHEACEALDDELKMDALAAEYLKRRQAMSESETRILRYVRRKGLDNLADSELEQRMLDGGLEGVEWRRLLARGGMAAPAPGSSPTVSRLSGRLTEIEESLREGKAAASPVQMAVELKAIAVQVDALADDTNRKVRDILEEYRNVGPPAAGAPPAAPHMTRKQLYEKLAEIGQEICQPLSVISCSITMITSGRMGDLSSSQTEILNLAVESAQKLKAIADNLMLIAGVPGDLEPNAAIQREIYGR